MIKCAFQDLTVVFGGYPAVPEQSYEFIGRYELDVDKYVEPHQNLADPHVDCELYLYEDQLVAVPMSSSEDSISSVYVRSIDSRGPFHVESAAPHRERMAASPV